MIILIKKEIYRFANSAQDPLKTLKRTSQTKKKREKRRHNQYITLFWIKQKREKR